MQYDGRLRFWNFWVHEKHKSFKYLESEYCFSLNKKVHYTLRAVISDHIAKNSFPAKVIFKCWNIKWELPLHRAVYIIFSCLSFLFDLFLFGSSVSLFFVLFTLFCFPWKNVIHYMENIDVENGFDCLCTGFWTQICVMLRFLLIIIVIVFLIVLFKFVFYLPCVSIGCGSILLVFRHITFVHVMDDISSL